MYFARSPSLPRQHPVLIRNHESMARMATTSSSAFHITTTFPSLFFNHDMLRIAFIEAAISRAREFEKVGYNEAARAYLQAARRAWSRELDIPFPDFTTTEWHNFDCAEYDRIRASMQQHVLLGRDDISYAVELLARRIGSRITGPHLILPSIIIPSQRFISTSGYLVKWSDTKRLDTEVRFLCPICREYVTFPSVHYRHQCGNRFCDCCLETWATKFGAFPTCPMCRGIL